MAFAETAKLAVELTLKDRLSSGIKSAERSLSGFDKATSRTQKSLAKAGKNLERAALIGVGAVTAGAFAVVNAAADYESAFAGVRKTVTATEPQLAKLSQGFRDMAKTIPIAAADLARLGEAGGALGVPTDQLQEFVRVTALLGVTTNLSADEAATSLGTLGNVLKFTAQDYSRFASSLVALGNAGASTESQIVAIAERSGAAGKLVGLATPKILGFASAVASLGIEEEAGGTALQKFYIDSTKAIAKGGKDLVLFAKVAGKSAKTFKKAFEKDAGGALQEFLAGLGKLPQAQQLDVLDRLGFSDTRITRTLLGLANNTKLVADQMQVANQAFQDNTALTKEADQRFKTFDSQLQITKNVLTDMAITIGSKLLPKLVPLLQKLNAFITGHQADIEKFGDNLATGFENFAAAVQKVDWQPFIQGLQLSADIAKKAIDLFMSLPPEVRAIAVTGFAVNKLTGGLLTSIAKDIGGMVAKLAVAQMTVTAGVVNVNGGLGTGVPTPGGGGLKGALGTAAKVAIPVAIAAVAIGASQQLSEALNPGVTERTKNLGNRAPLANADNSNPLVSRWNQYLGRTADNTAATRDATRPLADNDRQLLAAARAQAASVAAQKVATDRMLTAQQAQNGKFDAMILAARATSVAIAAKKWAVNVSIPVSVSTRVSISDYNKVSAQYAVLNRVRAI